MESEPQTVQEWFLIPIHLKEFTFSKPQKITTLFNKNTASKQVKNAATQTVQTEQGKAIPTQELPGTSAGRQPASWEQHLIACYLFLEQEPFCYVQCLHSSLQLSLDFRASRKLMPIPIPTSLGFPNLPTSIILLFLTNLPPLHILCFVLFCFALSPVIFILSSLAWIITSLSPGPSSIHSLFSLTLPSSATSYQQLPLILHLVAFSPQTNLDSMIASSHLSTPHPSNPITGFLHPFSLDFPLFVNPPSLGRIPLCYVYPCSLQKRPLGALRELFFPAPLHGQPGRSVPYRQQQFLLSGTVSAVSTTQPFYIMPARLIVSLDILSTTASSYAFN